MVYINIFNLFKSPKLLYLNTALVWVAVIILVISSFNLFQFRWDSVFLEAIPQKDEVGFLNNFNNFLNQGWYVSVQSGTSPLYNLFAYLIFIFYGNAFFSLKVLSVLSLFGLVFIWAYFFYKDLKIKGLNLLLCFFLLLNIALVRNVYFNAVDDPLFIVFMSIIFILLYRSIKNNTSSPVQYILIGVCCAAALSVRQLFVFYVIGLFLILVILFVLKRVKLISILNILFSFLIAVLIIHFPSIKENKTLSFHNKDFKKENVTYVEINYLGLIRNENRLIHGRNNKLRPTWRETVQYKKEHGEEVLPKTIMAAILKSPILTAKNFMGLFYLQVLPFIRQLGILYLFFMGCTIYKYMFKKSDELSLWIPFIFYLCFAMSLCVIPALLMEFRWFMMFTLLITVFSLKEMYLHKEKYPLIETIFLFNIIIIGLLNGFLVGIW